MSFVRELLNEYADKNYTPADVLSKVTAAEKEVQTNNDTTKFGLQDSNGEIVLVYVASDQAEDFEQAMARALADVDESTQPEIAEVLFNMHDQFNIVNVEWPGVVEDEEEDATDESEIEGNMDGEDEFGEDGSEDGEFGGEDDDMGDEDDDMGGDAAGGTLDAVIQMMVADSEAKRQEALARAAEARAKEAEASAKIADGKLRAEEEVADMEAYYDTKNEEQKEAKKLAKLAKYRHDAKSDDQEQDPMNYDEVQGMQDEDDMQGMDTAGREDIDPIMEPSNEEDSPLDTELDDFGAENEEKSADGPGNVNRQFKEIEDAIKYLHSLQVQKQAGNN